MFAKLTKIAGAALAATLFVPAAAEAHPDRWDHGHRWEQRGPDHRGWDRRGWGQRGWEHRRWESHRWDRARWERRGYYRDCRIVWRHHERVRICR